MSSGSQHRRQHHRQSTLWLPGSKEQAKELERKEIPERQEVGKPGKEEVGKAKERKEMRKEKAKERPKEIGKEKARRPGRQEKKEKEKEVARRRQNGGLQECQRRRLGDRKAKEKENKLQDGRRDLKETVASVESTATSGKIVGKFLGWKNNGGTSRPKKTKRSRCSREVKEDRR